MFFEHLDDQLKKEAATKVPVRAITAAILEVEQKFGSFLGSENRNERLAFVNEDVEKICIRQANAAGIDPEIVTSRVMEHLAADMTNEIYQGIEGSEVSAPKAIGVDEPIGGGPKGIQPGQPAPGGYDDRYKNVDVEEKQEEWHKDNRLATHIKEARPSDYLPSPEDYDALPHDPYWNTLDPLVQAKEIARRVKAEREQAEREQAEREQAKREQAEREQRERKTPVQPLPQNAQSVQVQTNPVISKAEHQDFERGGFVDIPGKPGSLVGTRHDAEEFDPNEQGNHEDGYKMVGGEAGGDTNPESHKKDKGNAKEVNPTSGGGKKKKDKKSEKNDAHKAPSHVDDNPQFHEINKKSFSLAEAERYHALRQAGVSHDQAEYIIKKGE